MGVLGGQRRKICNKQEIQSFDHKTRLSLQKQESKRKELRKERTQNASKKQTLMIKL